ncbi:hypothetical protein AK812_SmicGene8508 [Symbiodinium microadriaticum]|uniref:Uncharacterized protein n=1 Tax=Symbiodinium microadriaticum TaxID=2951 RepID=A0A1Q9EKW4_SYMMI|nr:hypothetical protein AK812_SmicGene8508 [Symbiodinium microadriaticum]
MSETEQSSGHGATDEALVLSASAEGKPQQLPESMRWDLGQTMPDAETLRNLCLDDSEWSGFIASFAADAAELDWSVRVIQALLAQVTTSAVLRRKRRAAAHAFLQWLSVRKQARTSVPATAPAHSLECLLRSGAKLRTRLKEPKGPACSRAEKELAAVTRWSGKFADILADASVPALRDVPSDMADRWALKLTGFLAFAVAFLFMVVIGVPFSFIDIEVDKAEGSLGICVENRSTCEKGTIAISAGTDNLGNTHVVSRLMTTKFPLLDWLPRAQNVEADSLTNGDFSAPEPFADAVEA